MAMSLSRSQGKWSSVQEEVRRRERFGRPSFGGDGDGGGVVYEHVAVDCVTDLGR